MIYKLASCLRVVCAVACLALLCSIAAAPCWAADPAAQAGEPRTPQRERWGWNKPQAEVLATGDLKWKPEPFVYQAGASVRYIDFDTGDDAKDGATQATAWKHHPWDANAAGQAKQCSGVQTYVFKRGVVYRGVLVARESGQPGNPIRLTSDAVWGEGEAILSGSQLVTGWKPGATNNAIPEGDKVWYADLDFLPRNVWEVRGDTAERLALARTPNWKISNPEDVLSEWWTWEQPEWWTGKWKIKTPDGPRHLGIDTKHLTGNSDMYVGATLRTEYGICMGTPFPTRVESFDAQKKGLVFQGIWFGDTETIITNMRYYLEDKPQFLDSPGEFWFERADNGQGNGGRLFLRLSGDRDPNTAVVEAARYINLIQDQAADKVPERIDYFQTPQIDQLDTTGVSHLSISGLTFRFTNTYWDLTVPAWWHKDVAGACIRLLGSDQDIQITHCRFEHVNRALRIEPLHNRCRVDGILVADNDIQDTDQGAIRIAIGGGRGTDAPGDHRPRLGDVKALRNRLSVIGQRNPRQDHDHALVVENAQTTEVAGNVIDHTRASGIFVQRGKDFGAAGDFPFGRTLVYNNRVFDSLLTANDWGGIEVNGAAPAFVYNNISGRPNGLWNWTYKPDAPGSGRLGMAYYLDGGASKTYVFNNIAWGRMGDARMPLAHCAFYEAGPNIFNTFFNNTISDFSMGSNWSPAGGRHLSLGNLWLNMGSWVWLHGKVKEDKDPPPAGEYPLFSDAYGRNIFFNISKDLAVFEADGRKHESIASMDAALAQKKSLLADVGTQAQTSPVIDAAQSDLRLTPDSTAIDRGAKVFVPWPLYAVVGEWNFRRNNADASVLLDDHLYPTSYYTDRVAYARFLLLPLKAVNVTAGDYTQGPLENWTDGALKLNGRDQYASLSHQEMTRPYTYDTGNGQKRTVSGKELATPDIDRSNFLIEAYFRTEPGHTGGTLVAKMNAAEGGYQLAVNQAGGLTLAVRSGQQASELSAGAGTSINDGRWHHVVAEVDRAAQQATIYVDGRQAAQDAITLSEGASLSNSADLLVGKGPGQDGAYFAGAIDFLRIARGTLADARTSIEELYDWEFDGPFLRDFGGRAPAGHARDAGALEYISQP